MKTPYLLSMLFLLLAITSCSNDDDGPSLVAIESETIENLHAPQSGGQGQPISGTFTKFDFESGQATTSDTDWDIAFRGTTIIVNGGTSQGTTDEPTRSGNAAAYITSGTLVSVTTVNSASFIQDSASSLAIPTGSDNGWYNYAGAPTFLVTPIAGKVLVFRTRDGKYAKVEILSYYKDAPSNPDAMVNESRYYTFNYVYQPNAGVETF